MHYLLPNQTDLKTFNKPVLFNIKTLKLKREIPYNRNRNTYKNKINLSNKSGLYNYIKIKEILSLNQDSV